MVFVFSPPQFISASNGSGSEQARPFDSGGLNRHLPTWSASSIQSQIEELTFSNDWRKPMALYVERLFDSFEHYKKAFSPTIADPLGLPFTDKLNFTWELLTRDELVFAGRLVGILDVTGENNTAPLSGQAIWAINEKQDARRLKYKKVNVADEDAKQALCDLCDACANLPGW